MEKQTHGLRQSALRGWCRSVALKRGVETVRLVTEHAGLGGDVAFVP